LSIANPVVAEPIVSIAAAITAAAARPVFFMVRFLLFRIKIRITL